MPEKTYKARVELDLILELNVDAVQEDEASATAEEIIWHEAHGVVNALLRNYKLPNVAVRCIEVEEYAGKDE